MAGRYYAKSHLSNVVAVESGDGGETQSLHAAMPGGMALKAWIEGVEGQRRGRRSFAG